MNEMLKCEVQAVADLVEKYHAPQSIEVKRGDAAATMVLIPKGMEAFSIKEWLDEYLTAPERRKGTARFTELASFVEHVKRFADADSAIFADKSSASPSLLAVLDYHRAGAEGAPRFGQHRAHYPFPLSDEWREWQAKNGQAMTQQQFAEWVENRISDVADPATAGAAAKDFAAKLGCDYASPSRLLELSRGLAVRVGQSVKQAVNLGTGEAQVQYVTTHQDEAGQPLRVPGAFLATLPVFRGGAYWQIPCRLRYRTKESQIVWFFEMWRADRAFDGAIDEACKHAKDETKLPVLFGAPEA